MERNAPFCSEPVDDLFFIGQKRNATLSADLVLRRSGYTFYNEDRGK